MPLSLCKMHEEQEARRGAQTPRIFGSTLRIPAGNFEPVPVIDPHTLTLSSKEAKPLRWWVRAPWDYFMMAIGLLY